MTRKLLVIAILLSLIVGLIPAGAQDTLPEGCTADALTALTDNLAAATTAANEAAAAGNLQDAIDGLSAARMDIAALEAVCAGLSWSGKADKVIGPVTIPEGVYRATATTKGYMIVHVTPIDGECGAGSGSFLSQGLFSASKGEATNGAEAIMTSRECSALLEISNVQSDWSLTLEKLG